MATEVSRTSQIARIATVVKNSARSCVFRITNGNEITKAAIIAGDQ